MVTYQVCSRLNSHYFSLITDLVKFIEDTSNKDTTVSKEIRKILETNLDNLEQIPSFKKWREENGHL